MVRYVVTAMFVATKAIWGCSAAVAVWVFICPAQAVLAQAAEPSVQQRSAAAEAYDRGTAAYLATDYERAAQWFETAHRIAPAAPALLQAIRANDRAGSKLRAATLSLRLLADYSSDEAAAKYGIQVLQEARTKYLRVDVRCQDCSIAVNGAPQQYPSFFLEPDQAHTVVADFESGEVSEEVSGAAGKSITLQFEAPRVSGEALRELPRQSVSRTDTLLRGEGDERADDGRNGGGLPPSLTFTAIGLTAVVAGLTVWSRLDSLAGVDAYEVQASKCQQAAYDPAHPDCIDATQRLNEGRGTEVRTSILLGASAALSAGSLILALFLTDWSGGRDSDEASIRFGALLVPGGGAGLLKARF
ncbi:MAG: hypothetical protein MJD61_16185 [Proteobacteria bacterium]|nr:hypothetical protein [Pseudomonadota bacterium]